MILNLLSAQLIHDTSILHKYASKKALAHARTFADSFSSIPAETEVGAMIQEEEAIGQNTVNGRKNKEYGRLGEQLRRHCATAGPRRPYAAYHKKYKGATFRSTPQGWGRAGARMEGGCVGGN